MYLDTVTTKVIFSESQIDDLSLWRAVYAPLQGSRHILRQQGTMNLKIKTKTNNWAQNYDPTSTNSNNQSWYKSFIHGYNKQKLLELHFCEWHIDSFFVRLIATFMAPSRTALGVKCARIILLFARHLAVRIHGTRVAHVFDHIDAAVGAAHVIVLTGVATLGAGILVGGGSLANFPKASFES